MAFLALLGAPYIYDISSLRVKVKIMKNGHAMYLQFIEQQETRKGLIFATFSSFAYVTDETILARGNLNPATF